MRLRVDLHGTGGKIGELLGGQFRGISRHLAAGNWQIDGAVQDLAVDGRDPSDVRRVLVWDDETLIFSGPRRGPVTRVRSVEGDSVTIVGVDAFGYLADRVAYPSVTVPPWAAGHDVQTGVTGGEAIAYYIAAAMTAFAPVGRPHTGITIVAGANTHGSVSTWSARLQPLDQLVNRIGRESGVACRITETATGSLVVDIKTPIDRSASKILSDQGDLENLSTIEQPATATYVIAAGQGDLAARAFATATTGATGKDRIETVVENTNITVPAELQKFADQKLAEFGPQYVVDADVTEQAAQRLVWRTDYDLGDFVGVEIDNVRRIAQVEAVKIEIGADRQVVAPVLGRKSANPMVKILQDIANLGDQFASQVS